MTRPLQVLADNFEKNLDCLFKVLVDLGLGRSHETYDAPSPTYPAFYLLNEHDAPEVVEIDGKLCICLFTEADHVGAFYRDKHGKGAEHAQVIAPHIRDELLQILKQWLPVFERDDVRFAVFDASPRRRPLYGELAEFVAMLEANAR